MGAFIRLCQSPGCKRKKGSCLKEIEEFVNIFSMMWKEVNRQFSDFSREEKLEVLRITSSALGFMDVAENGAPWDVNEKDRREDLR